jgi:Tfp pilus assembly protein PilN
MRSISASKWLRNPVLGEIKAEGAKSIQSNFKLTASLGKENENADTNKVKATK